MKILFIVPSLGYGGAMKNLVFVANTLVASHDVNILMYESKNVLQKVDSQIKIYAIERRSQRKLVKRFWDIYDIYSNVRRIRPDVIVSFLNFPNLYSVLVGKLLSIPVVISERGDPYQRLHGIDHFFDFFFNHADGAVFQTEGAKAYFGKRLKHRSVVIPNPIIRRVMVEQYVANDSHSIAFVGRFEIKQKRQDVLIEAFRLVKDRFEDATLNFYGTGDEEGFVKDKVHAYGLDDSVAFWGYVSAPEREIVKSEVFVLTSDYEGIPNALIEAMMLGMPVVSTDCSPGGAQLLIRDGENGLLVEKGNAIAVADAICRIFESTDLKDKLAKNACRICDDFAPDRISTEWDNYLHRIYNAYYCCNDAE